MCDLFRLVKVEVVFDQSDVDDLEESMLKAHEGFPEVLFVEEFFYSPDSKSKLDRHLRYSRGTPEDSVVDRKELEMGQTELAIRSVVDMAAQRARFGRRF
jgi:hypothetical protein